MPTMISCTMTEVVLLPPAARPLSMTTMPIPALKPVRQPSSPVSSMALTSSGVARMLTSLSMPMQTAMFSRSTSMITPVERILSSLSLSSRNWDTRKASILTSTVSAPPA